MDKRIRSTHFPFSFIYANLNPFPPLSFYATTKTYCNSNISTIFLPLDCSLVSTLGPYPNSTNISIPSHCSSSSSIQNWFASNMCNICSSKWTLEDGFLDELTDLYRLQRIDKNRNSFFLHFKLFHSMTKVKGHASKLKWDLLFVKPWYGVLYSVFSNFAASLFLNCVRINLYFFKNY